MKEKETLLTEEIRHFDIKSFNAIPMVEQFRHMAFQSRNIAEASEIYARMLRDENCGVILTLAGSLFSAGLKKIVYDLIENNMVDAIVSTGAIIVDQDFFEALGFKHYKGSPKADDHQLFQQEIDRIYDTYISEEDLRVCDETIANIADEIAPGVYSSREFIREMGAWLKREGKGEGSVVRLAYEKNVPIFVPAFSDCSAGFGLVYHQWHKENQPHVSIDSVKDFRELTKIKIESGDTGLVMMAGGVPKNFVQDVVVSADFLGHEASLHKYAIQVTVADERDGGLSGSTLQEAHSWGKVDIAAEQMVFCEATIAMPIIASYAYHKGDWKKRQAREWANLFTEKASV